MPRNKGTSRKGKPKKDARAAGMGRALEKYVFLFQADCVLFIVWMCMLIHCIELNCIACYLFPWCKHEIDHSTRGSHQSPMDPRGELVWPWHPERQILDSSLF
jgi:hypothetical protein